MASLRIKSNSSPRATRLSKFWFLYTSEPLLTTTSALVHSASATPGLWSASQTPQTPPAELCTCCSLCLTELLPALHMAGRQDLVIKGTELPRSKFGSTTYHLCGPGQVSKRLCPLVSSFVERR